MNIILVMSDTFRYDNLSCYGPTLCKTPRLDQFANESFVFDNAYLGSFPTIPCRLDLMSGRFSFIDHEWCPLPPDTVTLQQILSASGFVTQMIADTPHLMGMGYNYDRGFDGFEWIRGQAGDRWRTDPKQVELPKNRDKFRSVGYLSKIYLRNTSWWQKEEDHFAPRSILAACRWLEENQDRDQFFLYVDLFDPHEPWDAPQKYVDQYDSSYDGEPIFNPRIGFWEEFFTPEEMDHVRTLYMAEASMVDHWFGMLLNKVEELGLTEDTAVIFTSDHGYLFGEHGIAGKSLQPEVDDNMFFEIIPMYDHIRHVPLLIRLPGQTEGQHMDALVQIPDLMHTILEMAELMVTETIGGRSEVQALQCGVFYTQDWEFQPGNIHGRSLMPLMRSEVSQLRDIVVSSSTLIHHTPTVAKCAIITEDGWCLHYAGQYDQIESGGQLWILKLVDAEHARSPTGPALYYLPEDPKELNNVIHENEELAREIHERYVSWLEEAGTPEEHLAGRRNLQI